MQYNTISKYSSKSLCFLSTFNLVLIFFGYQLVATIFGSFMTEATGTRFITVPYRAVMLLLSIFLIYKGETKMTNSPLIVLLIFFWSVLIIRLVYDFYLQTNFEISQEGKNRTISYILGITLPSILAFARTWDKIDYYKALQWMEGVLIVITVYNLLFNEALLSKEILNNLSDGRVSGGLALNTISFGHCGASLALLSLYSLIYERKNVYKLFQLIICLSGLFLMIRSGSRGPLFTFFIVAVLFFACNGKSFLGGVLILCSIAALIILFKEQIMDIINKVSPVMYSRVEGTLLRGENSGRSEIYRHAIDIWTQYPIFGRYLTYYAPPQPYYPLYFHNVFLDALVQAGIFGFCIMAYFYFCIFKAFYFTIRFYKKYIGVMLLIMQSFISCLSSGAFYCTETLSIGLIFIVMLELTQKPSAKILYLN